ncbi:hypothetical protein QR680_015679 [Steinernema hermaphroditum]|uniref:Uncharacterized protein n=1 Tax=Steinernema hermaphroditum TaxID=289476 RepID=A0AA39H8M8_9BILA|nr:hypothetical protein QR680_015679 [Steinernema hermaphroditum]
MASLFFNLMCVMTKEDRGGLKRRPWAFRVLGCSSALILRTILELPLQSTNGRYWTTTTVVKELGVFSRTLMEMRPSIISEGVARNLQLTLHPFVQSWKYFNFRIFSSSVICLDEASL